MLSSSVRYEPLSGCSFGGSRPVNFEVLLSGKWRLQRFGCRVGASPPQLVAECDRSQPGGPVVAPGATQEDRPLVLDQLAPTVRARRIVDGAMLHLIKTWLEAPVEETDEEGKKRRSTRNRDEGR